MSIAVRSTILLAALLFPALAAHATTLLVLDAPALFDRSEVVAVVRVEELTVRRSGGRLYTLASARVERPFKGVAADERLSILVPGGEVGEWGQQVAGAPRLMRGERCLAFLEPGPGGYAQFVGLEQGRLRLSDDGAWLDPTAEALRIDPRTGRTVPPPARVESSTYFRRLEQLRREGR
jgi:hypothetical protein